jgi:hypothetical protein
MRSGVVDKMHAANRMEQNTAPLPEEDVNMAMPYFMEDLQLLKKEFNIEF